MNPRDTAIEQLEYALTKKNAPAIKMWVTNALTSLKSLEGQEAVAWIAVIRYPDGSESERYAATREGATQLGHESTRVSGTVISVLPLVRQSPQPSTPRLTVDEAMEVVRKWYNELGIIDLNGVSIPDDLRTRLTQAIKP